MVALSCKYLNFKFPIKIFRNFHCVESVEGLTIGLRRVRTYTQFYWRTHEFGYVYVDTYAYFFPMIFKLSNCCFFGSNNVVFQNVLLYAWPLICLSLEETDSLLFTFILRHVRQNFGTRTWSRTAIFQKLSNPGVLIRSFPGPYFLPFVLNTERYGVFLRTQTECRKIRTRKTPNTDTFYAVFFTA